MATDPPRTEAVEPRPEQEPEPSLAEADAGAQAHPGVQADRGVMLPQRGERPFAERLLMRIIATIGIVAIGVAFAAIMGSQKSQGWLIGLVVGIESVVLAAVLWSSRRM
jgi:hypothetical protein